MSKQEMANRNNNNIFYVSSPIVNNNSNNFSSSAENYYSPTSFSGASSPNFPSPTHNRRKVRSDATLAILSQLFQNTSQCPEYMNAVASIKNKQGEDDQNVFTLLQELAHQISVLDQQNSSLETQNNNLRAQVCEIATKKQQQQRDYEATRLRTLLDRSTMGRQRSTSMDDNNSYIVQSNQTSPRFSQTPIGSELPSPRLQKILSFKSSPPSTSRPCSACNSLITTPLWLPMENNELDSENNVSKSPTLNPITKRNSSSLHRNVLINQSAATPRIQKQNSFEFAFTPVDEDVDTDSSDEEGGPNPQARYRFY